MYMVTIKNTIHADAERKVTTRSNVACVQENTTRNAATCSEDIQSGRWKLPESRWDTWEKSADTSVLLEDEVRARSEHARAQTCTPRHVYSGVNASHTHTHTGTPHEHSHFHTSKLDRTLKLFTDAFTRATYCSRGSVKVFPHTPPGRVHAKQLNQINK